MNETGQPRLLAIDASSFWASAAILEGTACVGEVAIKTRRPARTLLPLLQELLRAMSLNVQDLDAIAVTTGPGSFTGIRVGMAAAQGLAQPFALPLLPVNTLDAVAEGCRHLRGPACVLQDARRERVYAARYDLSESEAVRTSPVIDTDPFQYLQSLSKPVILLGDAFEAFPEAARAAPAGSRQAEGPRFLAPAVASCGLRRFLRGETCLAGELEPEYVRHADAKLPAKRGA